MTGMSERGVASYFPAIQSTNLTTIHKEPNASEKKIIPDTTSKASFLSSVFRSTFTIFESYLGFPWEERKKINPGSYGWTTTMMKIVSDVSMRRLNELILWTHKPDVLCSTSGTWLLGICYKITSEESTNPNRGHVAFIKGFDAISDSNFTSDVNWGCMIRSSQMLIAQALFFLHLGRSWRRPHHKVCPIITGNVHISTKLRDLGGKPGASTCIVGVQDKKTLYLDPHEVKLVFDTIINYSCYISNALSGACFIELDFS